MKYILILYLCSLTTGQCPESQVTGYMFDSHYDCAVSGYAVSGQTYVQLSKDDYYGIDRLNREKIAIKFLCKELPTT